MAIRQDSEIIATAAQIRLAIHDVMSHPRKDGKEHHPTAFGWALLEVFKHTPQDDDDDDGLEPDRGSYSAEGKALRIFEDALDWEATFCVSKYIQYTKLLPAGKKFRDDVKFSSQRGYIRTEY